MKNVILNSLKIFSVVLAIGLPSAFLSSCGGGGGDGTTESASTPMTLSSSSLSPGEILSIKHPDISAEDDRMVTFETERGDQIHTQAVNVSNGSTQVAVPPLLDPESGFTRTGKVIVSLEGIEGTADLDVAEPPVFTDALPGEITLMLVEFTIENYNDILEHIDTLPAEQQSVLADLRSSILNHLSSLWDIAEDLYFGKLILTVDDGAVVLDKQMLEQVDRLVAAHFLGVVNADKAARVAAIGDTPRFHVASGFKTRQDFADILREIKKTGLPGIQLMGSYVSVTAGVTGLVAVFIPGGQPLATAAAGTAILATVITTAGTATISFFTDLSIDAVEGKDVDVHRAAGNALKVLEAGVRSIVLTGAGAINWAGSTLAGLVGLTNDANDGRNGLRDLMCGASSRSFSPLATAGEFCSATGGGENIGQPPEFPAYYKGTSTFTGSSGADTGIMRFVAYANGSVTLHYKGEDDAFYQSVYGTHENGSFTIEFNSQFSVSGFFDENSVSCSGGNQYGGASFSGARVGHDDFSDF